MNVDVIVRKMFILALLNVTISMQLMRKFSMNSLCN